MALNWNAGNIRWKPYTDAEKTSFPLNHLHPFRFQYTLPAGKGLPERVMMMQVGFGLHCFTRDCLPTDFEAWKYRDDREVRTFDFDRYELSKGLRQIIESMVTRQCRFAKHDNYASIEIVDDDGQKSEYGIFFSIRKLKPSDRLDPPLEPPQPQLLLVVQSAYRLDPDKPQPYSNEKIHFNSLVGHVLRGTTPTRKK